MAAPPTSSNMWTAPSTHLAAAQPAAASTAEESGLQARPMGLKVHYSFDRDNQVHCLARWPNILHIQTIPLDEKTTIGVVDLRTCLQAVSQSSPEILNQQENDFSVYAYDYSEPDVPLVGQGLLSSNLDPQRGSREQLVTGRVTRNLLALLHNGSRDTLEVKLKFATVARIPQRIDHPSIEGAKGTRSASIPAEAVSEWSSFIQTNTMLGHASNASASAVSSPALAPAQLSQHNPLMAESRPMGPRSDSQPPQLIRPATNPPFNGMPPVAIPPTSRPSSAAPIPPRPQGSAENVPSPAISQPVEPAPKPRPSKPSRSRSKQPTGRPRGRPRKRPLETGNTSAVEEGTDGDDGPHKKRATVTKTEYSAIAPFGATPDSLRVAASTSGSLRNMRPVGAVAEGPAANHLQDVPRAPTPIPDGRVLHQQHRRRALENQARVEHMNQMDQGGLDRAMLQNGSQDARSPADSNAQSPDHGYLPEDSAGDLNSSPPVPRATPYTQSSPPASSPMLPAMPIPLLDSGFMSGGLEDLFDEDMLHGFGQGQMQDQMLPVSSLSVASKPGPRRNGRSQSQPQQQQQQQPQPSNFPFQEVNPGPPELLPTKSIFNPAGKAKALNRQAPTAQPAPKKAANRPFNRSHTAPNPETFPPEPVPAPAMSMPIPERPEPQPSLPAPTQSPSRPASRPASRPVSRDAPVTSVEGPATRTSEPAPEPPLTLPCARASEPPCPQGDLEPPRYSKNLVKKQSIKEKLETAIMRGESPPFCSNCGAIETPTWRKIWTQDRDGDPGFHEFSDKPGCVTMIEVLERDEDEKPAKYRVVKKNLGPKDEKGKWTETLLCNPCGIWLGKFKVHRPPDRWDKDAARLNQPRRKREPKSNCRAKKGRTKSDVQVNPTSEAYFTTDPMGPLDHDFFLDNYENETQSRQQSVAMTDEQHLNFQSSPRQPFLGSTHSRGSGTVDSPIAVEDELGSTRRLLFPSPRRDGTPRVLGELSLNVTQAVAQGQEAKLAVAGKENGADQERQGTPVPQDELEQELFGTPPGRPSTPSPKAVAGPFKTPTRPTPSHRPITRSISRSIRSSRSIPKSPGQLFASHHLQQTPTKTPRSLGGFLHPSSASRRRSPRNIAAHHAQFSIEAADHNQLPMTMGLQMPMEFDSPFTATLHQLLSEANTFIGSGSPYRQGTSAPTAAAPGAAAPGAAAPGAAVSSSVGDLDLSHLDVGSGPGSDTVIDYSSFLGTDLILPSSPPVMRGGRAGGGGAGEPFGGVLQEGAMWNQQSMGGDGGASKGGR
ncbi:hypothetical protein F5144DRAFT_641274 [Chaetomium tenue]|uniref:Uncharacterized protein n=1 Tax=Chaetomium tenue TaxID=1854479 RepID=A0ACB7PM82_9PEZI|nr:hypothetical protein F5144DRAFT_641274 [Chaetomium globosum]